MGPWIQPRVFLFFTNEETGFEKFDLAQTLGGYFLLIAHDLAVGLSFPGILKSLGIPGTHCASQCGVRLLLLCLFPHCWDALKSGAAYSFSNHTPSYYTNSKN